MKWPTYSLADLAQINPKYIAPSSTGGDTPVSFVPMAAVSEVSGAIVREEERKYSDVSKGFTSFAKGDLLIAKITPCFENGKIAIADIAHPIGFGSTEFHVVRPNYDSLDIRYIYHFLRQPWIRNEGERKMTGSAGQRRIPTHFVENLTVPRPPLSEQKRIAAILDKADALRRKRREAIAKLDTLLQSVFLEMFGDPVKNHRNWPIHTIGEVLRRPANNGVFRKNPDYIDGANEGVPVVWVSELFTKGPIDTSESRRLVPTPAELKNYGLGYGDVLFCRSSLKLDGIAYNNIYLGSNDGALFECHLIRVSPNMEVIAPQYLNDVLRLPQMRAVAKSKSKTATMTTIDQKALCSIPIIVPPIDLQREFERSVEGIRRTRSRYADSEQTLNRLFAGLQAEQFQ